MAENIFLGKKGDEFELQTVKKYKEFFNSLFEISEFSFKIVSDLKINKDDGQQVITRCLFCRLIEGSQSAIILARRGLNLDVLVITRTIFETLVYLKQCCIDKQFVRHYIQIDERERLHLINAIFECTEEVFPGLKEEGQRKQLLKIKENIKSKNIARYSLESLAKAVDLSGFYDTFYRSASQKTHASPRSLEKYICTDIKGDVCSLSFSPSSQNIGINLITIGEFLLRADESICNLFGLEKERVYRLAEGLKILVGKIKDEET